MPSTTDLDYTDQTDHINAQRGLIDQLDPCVIRDDDGKVVWDNTQWDFLEQGCPDTADPSLWRQSRLNTAHGLFAVAPGVYQVRGLDIANMTIIEGKSGIVVIDPLTAKEASAAGLKLYRRNRGPRVVRAVLYTHSHADHFGGVLGVTTVEDVAEGRCIVVAPEGFMHHAVSENVFAGPAMRRRAMFMCGTELNPGPAGHIGFGLGQALSGGTRGLIRPTVEITDTGEEIDVDGIRLVFQMVPDSEAPSEMNIYLPECRVLLIAEIAQHTLHNILTLRGALVRDARAWAAYITEAIELYPDAEVLVGSHHWPTWGSDAVRALLTEQRDAYAYIHDQTVRLMNQGLTGTEIAEVLSEFPGEQGKAWSIRGYYGSMSHNVKAVYQRYMGWYDGNPAHLWQHPPVEQAKRYVAAIGGSEVVLEKGLEAIKSGDLRWAAELLNHLLFAEPTNARARDLQAHAYEQLGFAQENGTWRCIYLTGAAELRAVGSEQSSIHRSEMPTALSTEQIFQSLAVRLDGPRAANARLVLRWELSDPEESWTVTIRNGVLTAVPGIGRELPQVTLYLSRATLNEIVADLASVSKATAAGAISVGGDPSVLTAFLDLIDSPPSLFAVALP